MSEYFLYNKNVKRFEEMISKKQTWYYDPEEIVDVITFYVDVNDLKNARKALGYGFDIHPGHLEIQVKKVEVLIADRKFTPAQQLITKLMPMLSSHTDLLVAQAKIFSIKKQYEQAIKCYQKALKNGEEIVFLHNSIGNEYLNMNNNTAALYHFEKVLKMNPEDEYAFYSVIGCYNKKRDISRCIAFLKGYIDQYPYADYAWYKLGLQYVKQDDFAEAIRSFDFAIVINDRFLSAYMQKANALEKIGDIKQAIDVYKSALEYDDTPSFTHLKIGLCYKRVNRIKKALNSFYNSIYDDPQMDKAWEEIATIYAEQDKLFEALYYLKRAAELNPENIDYLKKYIIYSVKNQDLYEAIDAYEKLVDLLPQDENVVLGMVELLIFTKDYTGAITLLKDYKESSDKPEALYYLSFCYFLTRENRLGLELFKKAYQLAPELTTNYQKRFPEVFVNKSVKEFLQIG